jgi:hypothetical protein
MRWRRRRCVADDRRGGHDDHTRIGHHHDRSPGGDRRPGHHAAIRSRRGAKDDVDPSPDCGYTSTNKDDSPYTVTITSRWTLTYPLSNGGSGTLDDVELTNSFDDEVIEIQTIGASG